MDISPKQKDFLKFAKLFISIWRPRWRGVRVLEWEASLILMVQQTLGCCGTMVHGNCLTDGIYLENKNVMLSVTTHILLAIPWSVIKIGSMQYLVFINQHICTFITILISAILRYVFAKFGVFSKPLLLYDDHNICVPSFLPRLTYPIHHLTNPLQGLAWKI